jgi:hypothetical protein
LFVWLTVDPKLDRPLNDLQTDIVKAFATLRFGSPDGPVGGDGNSDSNSSLPTRQGEASRWIESVVKDVLGGKHVRTATTNGAAPTDEA